MQLVVPEVHPANWWCFWSLSFVIPVTVRVMHPWCTRWPRGHLRLLDLDAFFTSDTAIRFKSDALRAWEQWLDHVPSAPWAASYRGVPLNFIVKVKQELSRHFERLLLLKAVQDRQGADAYLVRSAHAQYLSRLDPASPLFHYQTLRWLSRLNVLCDLLWLWLLNAGYGIRLICWLIRGLNCREGGGGTAPPQASVRFIYDCDNSNELTADQEGRHFRWLVDGQTIPKEHILFLLPSAVSSPWVDAVRTEGYMVLTLPEAYRAADRPELAAVLGQTVRYLVNPGWCRGGCLVSLMMGRYLIKTGELAPIVRRWQPRVYIESVSSMGLEHPGLVYLNAMGVVTLMYHMSASYVFGQDGRVVGDFRSTYYAHVMASVMVVWHADYRRFFESHPQDGVRIVVVGPLMPGQEAVMQRDPVALRRHYLAKWPTDPSGVRYVTAFDVGSPSRQFLLQERSYHEVFTYPDPYDEAYNLRFLQDLWCLLQERADICLLFKPKRNPWHRTRFLYSEAYRQILQHIDAHPRGLVMDEAVNPWLPIALADVCIVLPLTSPGLATLHYGRHVIYHDPLDIVRVHRFQPLKELMTHNYPELSARLDVLAAGTTRSLARDVTAPFLGSVPRTNSTEQFRQLLQSVADHTAIDRETPFERPPANHEAILDRLPAERCAKE